MFKKQVCPIHLKHVSSSKMVLRECSTSEDKGQCWGHGGRPLVVFCSTDWDAHYSIAMEQMSALLFQIDTETSQISWKTETSLTSQWLNWFKLYQTHIFTGPRCLWGPVYGSRSLYLTPYIRQLCETLLMWLWLMMIPTQYDWWCQFKAIPCNS